MMYTVKRYLMMVLGILLIGICVGAYRLGAFGVDAFTCMNLGISQFVHLSFGTWQLIMNAAILAVMFCRARRCIGPGTVVNMVGVGYLADFLCWLFQDVWQVPVTLPLRLAALAAGTVLAGLGVALYMAAGLGVAPYDSVAIIIEELTGGNIPFRRARVLSDVASVAAGVLFCLLAGGGVGRILGIGTVCNALFNGPVIQFFKTRVAEPILRK